jgi:Protein of Unknown function (DUF2784)
VDLCQTWWRWRQAREPEKNDFVVTYDALADLVVTIHAAYVGFVVLGFMAIVLGSAMGWRWVRNLYFRVAHLAAILLVCLEALTGVSCPLTTLENRLRVLGRGRPYAGAFVGHLLDRLVFYNFPQWLFTIIYLSFGALVVLTFILVPPRLGGWTKPPQRWREPPSVPQR